jgi:hypothetical protein
MFSFLFRKPTNKMYYTDTNIQSYIRKIENDLNEKALNEKTIIVPSKIETNKILTMSYESPLLSFISIVFFLAGYKFKNWIK